jgi:hypothetical protein
LPAPIAPSPIGQGAKAKNSRGDAQASHDARRDAPDPEVFYFNCDQPR